MIKVLDHINVTTHNFQKCIMEFLCRFFSFFVCQLNNHMLLNNNAIEFTVLSLTASLSFLSEINMMLSYWDAFRRIVGYHFAACISYGERWLSLQVNGEKFAHGKITLSEQTKWCWLSFECLLLNFMFVWRKWSTLHKSRCKYRWRN